ncbi:MAG: hypothetical protein P4L40_02720 [Terracidiphilus sp.]|nr:hypothetical protein [Terracidiphilus sp.]
MRTSAPTWPPVQHPEGTAAAAVNSTETAAPAAAAAAAVTVGTPHNVRINLNVLVSPKLIPIVLLLLYLIYRFSLHLPWMT